MNTSHNVSIFLLGNLSKDATPFDIFITNMTCFVFLPILFGNCLTVMAYIKFRDLRSNTTLLISSMAVSDLAVGVFYITTTWYVSHIDSAPSKTVCEVIFMTENMVCMTFLLHLIALNTERYLHIAHPFFYSRRFTKSVTWIIIAGIYVALATTLMIINFWLLEFAEISTEFIVIANNKYISLLPLLWFGLPLGLLSVMCAAIYKIVNKHLRFILEQRVVNQSVGSNQQPVTTNKRTIKTIAAVLLAFFLTSSPQKIALLIAPFVGVESNQKMILYVFPITKLLLLMNSAVNPVIYGLFYPRYKLAYKIILEITSPRSDSILP